MAAAFPSTAASGRAAEAAAAAPMETDDAVGAAAGVPPPVQVQLLELPDELLSLITLSAYEKGCYVNLFCACKRLRDLGYASIRAVSFRARSEDDESEMERVSVSPPLSSPVALLASPRGAAMYAHLRSALGFLGHAHGVRDVTLHECTRYDSGWVPDADDSDADADILYYALLLPALRRLPLTSFSASLVAVHLLRGPPLSSAPLRRLRLDLIEQHPADAAAVRSVLGHHGGSLVELTLSGVFRDDEPTSYEIAPWLDAASAGMPNLHTLTLDVDVDEEAAAAVARLCPALTTLCVVSKSFPNACAPLRLPALPSLSRLDWAGSQVAPPAAGVGLAALVGGRTFMKLRLAGMSAVEVLPAVKAAAAVPPDFDLECSRPLGDNHMLQLLDGTPTGLDAVRRLQLHLGRSATWDGVRLLNRLGALTDLTVIFSGRLTQRHTSPPPKGLLAPLKLREWPVARLHRLSVSLSLFERVRGDWVVDLLHGLAASGSQHSLRELRLRGPELSEAAAADPLAALTRLAYLDYDVQCPRGVFSDGPEVKGARDRMATWLHQRLPALQHSLGRRRRILGRSPK